MDGLTATRHIREHEQQHGTGHMPIIALTADAGKEDIELSRDAGCDAHLTKPISQKTLLAAIRKYARQLDPQRYTTVSHEPRLSSYES
jgi:CheY-like chemotaxis protein